MTVKTPDDRNWWVPLALTFLALPATVAAQCDVLPTLRADTIFLGCHQLSSTLITGTDYCYDYSTEDCGTVEVCISDRMLTQAADCSDTTTLLRTYAATDPAGEIVTKEQIFHFIRPVLTDLIGVTNTAFSTCSPDPAAKQFPEPTASDLPFLITPSGRVSLATGQCGYGVSYSDGIPTASCGNGFNFLRTFTVVDSCQGGIRRTFTQRVEIGDRQGPVIVPPSQDLDFNGEGDDGGLVFGTNVSCGAIIDLRGNVSISDGCGGATELLAYIFIDAEPTSRPLGPYLVTGGTTQDALSDALPPGNHLIRYVGSDSCQNTSLVEVPLRIIDQSPPVALCNPELTVHLNNAGLGQVEASAVDGGSFDDCSSVQLTVGRAAPGQRPTGPLTPNFSVDCTDAGNVSVILVATDTSGRQSDCWVEVAVVDALPPFCFAPPNREITCLDYASIFPADLAAAYRADPAGIGSLLNATFGGFNGVDNCTAPTLAQSVSSEFNGCGSGLIQRTFTTTDARGFDQEAPCLQQIIVSPYQDYRITFPADASFTCAENFAPPTVTTEENGCDQITVEITTDTLAADDVSCLRLRNTYDIINWCEYDGNSNLIEIARPARNAETSILTVAGNSATHAARPLSGYASDTRRGAFRYTQIISLQDDTPPVLEIGNLEGGIAYTADCQGDVRFNFSSSDACTTPDFTVEIDLDPFDTNGDGELTARDFRGEITISSSRIVSKSATEFAASVGNLPIGNHLVHYRATDHCGNATDRYESFEIVDGKAPSPNCTGTVRVALAPNAEFGGSTTITYADLIASPATVCTPVDLTYSVYRESEALVTGFVPEPNRAMAFFSCPDLGNQVVRLYAFAPDGQWDYCQTVVQVASPATALCADRRGTITGTILTDQGMPVPGVEVYNDAISRQVTTTDETGYFEFNGLREGEDFTTTPILDRDHLNGVSTLDILLIGRYLLGEGDPWTPYQFIAADANRSRAVTILDLIHIRRVVLDLDADFDNNTSWRFIPRDYVFPDLTNPWAERFPEEANNHLTAPAVADFVAVKVGDVSGNADPTSYGRSSEGEGGRRSAGAVPLTLNPTNDGNSQIGLYLTETGDLSGLQFTLEFADPATALAARTPDLEGLQTRLEGSRLHLSYAPSSLNSSQPLLLLPPESLHNPPAIVHDRGALPAEAYGDDLKSVRTLKLGVNTGSTSIYASVSPNPIRQSAILALSWPVAEVTTLRLFSGDGRLIGSRPLSLTAGPNKIALDQRDFAGAEGMILLSVAGQDGRSVRCRLIKQ